MALIYAGAVRMKPALTPISEIDKDFVGLKTEVSGRVIEAREHSQGHLFLKVKDESGGVIHIPIFSSIKSKLGEKIDLLDRVQVSGRIESYQGTLELIPEGTKDIKIIHTPPQEISKVDREDLGKRVKVRGFVGKNTSVGAGSLLINLQNEGRSFPIFIPQNVAKTGNFPEIQEGQTIQVSGRVQLYEGELEIKVSNSHNIDVVGDTR